MIGNLANDPRTPSHTRRLFQAIGREDKEMHEITSATSYCARPDQRYALRATVTIGTDWLMPHDFAGAE